MRDYASLQTQLLQDLGVGSDFNDYPITSDMDNRRVGAVALAKSFYKKLCPDGNSESADLAALNKFKAINDALSVLPKDFIAYNEAESCFYDYYRDNLRVALEPHESIGTFDLGFIRDHMMVGPGAAQKADSTYMVSKLFESTISYTNPHLISWYRSALAETGLWADAEMHRFHLFGFTKVHGGKIFFAPKDSAISRTCCTEASLNMLIQQAIGSFLEVRLGKFFGITLDKQPGLNQEFARIGSIDGSYGTIDLVSASDSISLQLIKRDIPDGFLKAAILNSRSEYAVLPDGSQVELNMVSTMGNGFTFPLQTILFASVVKAVYQVMDIPFIDKRGFRSFGVFGDDICVRKEAYYFVSKMLIRLGFSVNVNKSFNTGLFRESCGKDYFNGFNVRGVYIRSLETPQTVYSAINRLSRWSAHMGVPLTNTLKVLLSWVRDIRIPPSESDDAGIKVPFRCTIPRLNTSYWFKYRAYVKRVRKLAVLEPDAEPPPINPLGIGVGFLSGHIRRRDILLNHPILDPDGFSLDSSWKHDWSISVSIRDKMGARSRYNVVHKAIPHWDWIRDESLMLSPGWLPPLRGVTNRVDFSKSVGSPWDLEERHCLTAMTHDAWDGIMGALLSK